MTGWSGKYEFHPSVSIKVSNSSLLIFLLLTLEKTAGFFQKTSEIANAIGKIIGNKSFEDNVLARAGSIGALISIGIGIYQQIKYDLQSKEEQAFASLIKIAFEAAHDSLPERDEISIKDEGIFMELLKIFL